MTDRASAIGEAVRAGFSSLPLAVSRCWAALALAAVVAIVAQTQAHAPALAFLVNLLAATLAYGALYRNAFAGPHGIAGLRWGRDEWRLLAVQALIGVIFAVLIAVLSVVVGAVALGVARANAPGFDAMSPEAWRAALSGPGAIVAGVVPLLCLALLIWVGLRLSLTLAMTADTRRVSVLSAFPLTRGQIPTLLATGVVVIAPLFLLGTIGGIISYLTKGMVDATAMNGLSALVAYVYVAPVWTGAVVHVYRHQRPPSATLPQDLADVDLLAH